MKNNLIFTCWMAASLALANHQALAQRAEELFQKGVQLEEVKGELAKAIELYNDVVKTSLADKSLTARALLRLGHCYEKLGKKEATKAYERIVKDFADQREVAAEARGRLLALESASRAPKSPELKVQRVWTGPGVDIEGGISSDGRYLSFTDWSSGDLALRDMTTGEIKRLTRKGSWFSHEYADFSAVSPDGQEVAYAWLDSSGDCSLRLVRVDDTEMRILNADTSYLVPEAWSHDRSSILTTRWSRRGREITSISTADGSMRVLKTFGRGGPLKVSVSPDDRWVAYDSYQSEQPYDRDIFLLAMDGSRSVRLVDHQANDFMPVWAADGKSVLFCSDRGGTPGIWSISILNGQAQGSPQLIKPDIGNVRLFDIAKNGTLYYGLRVGGDDVYRADIDLAGGKLLSDPVAVSKRFVGSNSTPACSPDGQFLAYISSRGNVMDHLAPGRRILVVQSLRTGEEHELAVKFGPGFEIAWAPDSRSFMVVGFLSDNQLGPSLFRVDARTGESHVLLERAWTTSGGDASKGWFPDGKSVYITRGMPMRLVRHDLANGQEQQILGWKPKESEIRFAALSPDGSQFAAWRRVPGTGLLAIVLFPAGGGEPRELFSMSERASRDWVATPGGLAWTTDGKHILFAKRTEADDRMDLWRIDVAGGGTHRLGSLGRRMQDLVVHPDGKRIFFSAREQICDVWAMEDFLPSERSGATLKKAETEFTLTKLHTGDFASSISPDGKQLAVAASSGILMRNIESGKEVPLPIELSLSKRQLLWSPDSKMLAFMDKINNLCVVAAAGGPSTILCDADPSAVNAEDLMTPKSWSADGKRVIVHVPTRGLFAVPVAGGTMEALLVFQDTVKARAYGGMTLSPDERMVAFVSSQQGNKDIYVMPAKGGEPIRVTTNPTDDVDPVWSYDSRWIAFLSKRTESPEVWVIKISADGRPEGAEFQVSRGGYWGGTWTKDGRIGYCSAYRTEHVFTADPDGSEETQVTHFPAMNSSPVWFPDGKRIAFKSDYGQALNFFRLWAASCAGGKANLLAPGENAAVGGSQCISPDGRMMAYITRQGALRPNTSVIKLVPTGGGEPKDLLSFDREIEDLDWSPDGASILFTHSLRPPRYADAEEYMRERQCGISIVSVKDGSVKSVMPAEKKGRWYPFARWSPDGKQILFGTGDYEEWKKGELKQAGYDLLVRNMKTGNAKLVVKNVDGYSGCWCPDGKSVVFERRLTGMDFALYRVPADGGTPEKMNMKGRSATFSPDGKKIAYSRRIGQGYEFWLVENFLH